MLDNRSVRLDFDMAILALESTYFDRMTNVYLFQGDLSGPSAELAGWFVALERTPSRATVVLAKAREDANGDVGPSDKLHILHKLFTAAGEAQNAEGPGSLAIGVGALWALFTSPGIVPNWDWLAERVAQQRD
jgi:hypothetical protein